MWALAGVPVGAEPGSHPAELSIDDGQGVQVSTLVPLTVVAADFGTEMINVPPGRQSLLEADVILAETERLHRVFGSVTPQQLWLGLFVWPHQGEITSPYGMSRTYNGSRSGYHLGIDINGDEGAPVVAANSGRVALADALQVHGNSVVLDHGWGLYSLYGHLSEILVQEGQEVTRGDLIGRLGNTGLSTGAHLHWEMRVGDVAVNPLEWTSRLIPE